MGLETGVTYIEDLVDTNPLAGDNPSEGDDHIRNTKTAVQGSFPNLGAAAVTSTAVELNIMDGVTSFLDDDTMAADSATSIASQQSIKAYVDNKLASTSSKIVEIGDWDMDADVSTDAFHGLTYTNIRSVTALIRRDDNNLYLDLMTLDGNETSLSGILVNNSVITLYRGTAGVFDTASYDSTGFNRGWITIIYAD